MVMAYHLRCPHHHYIVLHNGTDPDVIPPGLISGLLLTGQFLSDNQTVVSNICKPQVGLFGYAIHIIYTITLINP